MQSYGMNCAGRVSCRGFIGRRGVVLRPREPLPYFDEKICINCMQFGANFKSMALVMSEEFRV